jgi:hypothetical protein
MYLNAETQSQVLARAQPAQRGQATNRRGRAVTCRVTCTPLLDRDKTLRGVIVVVADDPGQQAPVAPVL